MKKLDIHISDIVEKIDLKILLSTALIISLKRILKIKPFLLLSLMIPEITLKLY